MRKYLYIYKSTLIENLQYVSDIVIRFINFFVMMFIFLSLWEYMYSDPSQVINGYTMKQMIWYVLLSEVLWFGARNKVAIREISKDIRTGNVAYNINKPYNYVFYIMAKNFGEITIKFIMFAIVGCIIGIGFIGPIQNFNFINLPFMIIPIILAIFINSAIRISISILSFWIEDSTPFHWVYDKFILLCGTLFPIEMFPTFLRPIIQCTPILVTTYGPVKLIIDFTWKKFIEILIVQLIYFVIIIAIIMFLYNKGVKKLNVNGG